MHTYAAERNTNHLWKRWVSMEIEKVSVWIGGEGN